MCLSPEKKILAFLQWRKYLNFKFCIKKNAPTCLSNNIQILSPERPFIQNLYSNKLYIGITISRYRALTIDVSFIFDIIDLNRTFILKVSFLFLLF